MLKLMKPTFLLLLLFSASTSIIFAQEQKFFVGGNFATQYSSTMFMNGLSASSGISTLGASFGPTFGYFIKKKVVLGAELDFNWTRSVYGDYAFTINPSNYSVLRNVSISPFVRKYFDNSLFVHGGITVGKSYMETFQSDSFMPNYQQKYNSFGLGIGLGYSFSLCEKVRFEPMLKYNLVRYNGQNDQSMDNLKSNISLSFGFTYRF